MTNYRKLKVNQFSELEETLGPEEYLLKIEQGVLEKDPVVIKNLLGGFTQTGLAADAVLEALTSGIEKAREEFGIEAFSLPEFLLCLDTFRSGVKCLEAVAPGFSKQSEDTVILIGVAEGDVHDLGKNMVASVLDASGFHVIDLGREVTGDQLVQEISKKNPVLIALSSMMSTSLDNMREIIQQVKREYPAIKILVGGAALDNKIANAIGSDGFADSAVTAPEEAKRILR